MSFSKAALERITGAIQHDLGDLGIARGRTGYIRGTAWTEWSGRLPDGARATLRLRHRFGRGGGVIRGGLLLTRSLGQGGKTENVGSATHEYQVEAEGAEQAMIGDILGWLDRIRRRVAVVA